MRQSQFDIRLRCLKFLQDFRRVSVDRIVGISDPKGPDFTLMNPLGIFDDLSGSVQNLLAPFQKGLTGCRNLHAAVAAHEQGHAQRTFEVLDGAAQSGLRHAEFLGRFVKMKLFGDGHKASEVSKIYAHDAQIISIPTILILYS